MNAGVTDANQSLVVVLCYCYMTGTVEEAQCIEEGARPMNSAKTSSFLTLKEKIKMLKVKKENLILVHPEVKYHTSNTKMFEGCERNFTSDR